MSAHPLLTEDDALGGLFDAAPDRPVRTSVAAGLAFVLGLVAMVAVPFSLMHAVSAAVAGVGAVLGVVGVAATSRPDVAGRLLAPVGLLFCLVGLTLVGMRYAGLDTAYGDALVPTILSGLESLNDWFPTP